MAGYVEYQQPAQSRISRCELHHFVLTSQILGIPAFDSKDVMPRHRYSYDVTFHEEAKPKRNKRNRDRPKDAGDTMPVALIVVILLPILLLIIGIILSV